MAEFRNPAGVLVTVSEKTAERLGPEWKREGETTDNRSETPDKSWTVADLKAYAAERSIDLGKSTRKGDIVAAIAAAPAGDDDESDESDDE